MGREIQIASVLLLLCCSLLFSAEPPRLKVPPKLNVPKLKVKNDLFLAGSFPKIQELDCDPITGL